MAFQLALRAPSPAQRMLRTYQYWILTASAAASLLLVALDIRLVRSNQALRTAVDNRARYIQEGEPALT